MEGVDPARWTGLKDLGPLALMPARFPIFAADTKRAVGGSFVVEDGSLVAKDGLFVVEDGSLDRQDGSLVAKDGLFGAQDGSLDRQDGSLVIQCGSLVVPD